MNMPPLMEAAEAISACLRIPGQSCRCGNLPQPVIPAVRGRCRHLSRPTGPAFTAAGMEEAKEFSRTVTLRADGGPCGPGCGSPGARLTRRPGAEYPQ